jgi:glycosyltransferase involved in cell wall biosynthesis
MTRSITPKILFIVNAPNWAHDYKTRSLQRTLGDEYQILKRFQSNVTEADLENADLIAVYYWMQFDSMKHLIPAFLRNRHKLLIGVCSHFELEGEQRTPGLATLRRMARGVFANNLFLYHELQSVMETPVFYTPNGVATDFYQPSLETSDREMQNGLRSQLKTSLSSISSIVKKFSNRVGESAIRVGWAGSLTNHGPDQRGVHDFIIPAARSVKAVEVVLAAREEKWRGPDEMLEFYRSIDIYICASRSEGTPNPCLEAAACGVPVVTTRVGNMPELIQHGSNGLFVERDISDIANKLTQLRDSSRLRAELGQSMLASIRNWDWKHQAENYRNMFETILNN